MRTRTRAPLLGNDRGAILVHVALILLVLMAFTTFVADYGLLWVSRRQAQNSADAAALAGAIGLAFDNASDLTDTGAAKLSAFAASQDNLVWGQPPSVIKATDITFATCPSGSGNCIRVNVYRNFERGNQLPVFFGYFVGLTSQGIRATATAAVEAANATTCLKPWAVIDKWAEHWPIDPGTWTLGSSTFDKYDKWGNLDPAITTPDVFTAPTAYDFGTGFHPFEADGHTYTSDWGREMILKEGQQSDYSFATGWFAALALTNSTGGNDYNYNIEHCVGVTYKVGDLIQTEPGQMQGPTAQGVLTDVNSLINQDVNAVWDPSLNAGHGGVRGSAYTLSPRIVAIPLVNPDIMMQLNSGGRTTVPISNIMGFFIASFDNSAKSITGYMQPMPGEFVAGGGPTGPGGSFLRAIVLVR
jgi:Flp pilus assembly protein TadG